jgi:hypothetical protein
VKAATTPATAAATRAASQARREVCTLRMPIELVKFL